MTRAIRRQMFRNSKWNQNTTPKRELPSMNRSQRRFDAKRYRADRWQMFAA